MADNDEMPVAEEEEHEMVADKNDGDDSKEASKPKRWEKPEPGNGLPPTDPDCIEFKWNKEFKTKTDCDTLHMLYLLQIALNKVRIRTNERNKYFKSIGRKDRYISHLDAPQVITNFLMWHNKDKEKNVFDGKLLDSAEKLTVINDYISNIGDVRKGPATKIYTKLRKDVILQTTEWCDTPQPTLKLETWGWSKLYKEEKILDECTTEEILTVLMYVGPDDDDDEKKGDEDNHVTKGVFQMMEEANATKRKKSQLIGLHEFGAEMNGDDGLSADDPLGINQKCVEIWKGQNPDKDVKDYWKYRVMAFIKGEPRILPDDYEDPPVPEDANKAKAHEVGGGPYTGEMINGETAIPPKQLATRLINYLLPIGTVKQKKKTPANKILTGAVSQFWRDLKKCYIHGVLEAAAKQQKLYQGDDSSLQSDDEDIPYKPMCSDTSSPPNCIVSDVVTETADEEIEDNVNMIVIDELEDILNQGLEKWMSAYYQFMELKQLLINDTDGVITCNGPENNDNDNGGTGGSGASNVHKSNINYKENRNRQKEKQKNDNNDDDDDGDEEQKGDHKSSQDTFEPPCNHLNECDQCSEILATKSKQIKLFKGTVHNLQQQQEYNASFVERMDEIIKNGSNGQKVKRKSTKSKLKYRPQDRAHYDPHNTFRAKGIIKIERQFTNDMMKERTMERITDFYGYLDKTIAMQCEHKQIEVNDDRKCEDMIIKLDLRDRKTGGALYSVIKRNDADKSERYKYKMINKLFISSDPYLSGRILPKSSRYKFQIQHQMDQIKEILQKPTNVAKIMKCKLNKIQVFRKEENQQRMTLFITPERLNQKIKDHMSRYREQIIIPIVMFKNDKHWIEYIVVIDTYSFGSIGVSLCYDERNNLYITGFHLDWTAIKSQHAIALPHHMWRCKCFDGITHVIDHLHVGNPDDLINKMNSQQIRYQMKAEVLKKVEDHASKYIYHLHSKQTKCNKSTSLSATNSIIVADSPSNDEWKIEEEDTNMHSKKDATDNGHEEEKHIEYVTLDNLAEDLPKKQDNTPDVMDEVDDKPMNSGFDEKQSDEKEQESVFGNLKKMMLKFTIP